MSNFNEKNSDFYDLEYYIALEYRHLSGAHGSKIRNIFKTIRKGCGNLHGKRILDVGCGGGFFANEFFKLGADVVGIDYSKYAINFSKDRFSDIDFRVASGYSLEMFEKESFDIVTLLDVIEHMSNQNETLSELYRVLKPGGYLVISTDVNGGIWSKEYITTIIRQSNRFSIEGRAYMLIKKVEEFRKKFRDYHDSHIKELSCHDMQQLLQKYNFNIIRHKIYPLVGVPIRDVFLRLLPKSFRGDHQCIISQK